MRWCTCKNTVLSEPDTRKGRMVPCRGDQESQTCRQNGRPGPLRVGAPGSKQATELETAGDVPTHRAEDS